MAAKKQEWIQLIKKIDTQNFARWFCVFFLAQKGQLALHTDRNSEVFGNNGNNWSSMYSLRRSVRLQKNKNSDNQPTTGLNQSPELFLDSADLSNISDVLDNGLNQSLDTSFDPVSPIIVPSASDQSETKRPAKRARSSTSTVGTPNSNKKQKQSEPNSKRHYKVWHKDQWTKGWGETGLLGVGKDEKTIRGKPWRAKYKKSHQRRFALQGDAAEHIYRLKLQEENKNLDLQK